VKVSIIVAVYNEAATVATLLDRVWDQVLPGIDKEIIIVESNSNDGSRQLVAAFVAKHAGEPATRVHAIYEDRARGKGHAVRRAFAAASGDILLIQDADLEYDVADYPDLLEPIVNGRCALVLGSRHMGASGWKIRKFGNAGPTCWLMNVGGALFHAFFNLVFASRLTDPTSMFKVFRADCLNGLQFTCERFDFDYELLGKLMRSGFEPLEIPVSYRSRGFDEGKKIRILKDPLTWVYAILRCRFSRLRRRYPLGQDDGAGLGQAADSMAEGVGLPFGVLMVDKNRGAPGSSPGLHVPPTIADHEAQC
jgi:glycosyltransferase involved in cell wall biosynthesis